MSTRRDIKFRIWTYGKLVHDPNYLFKPFEASGASPDDIRLSEILNNPHYMLSQFTGLKDVQGVDIYEGDILSWEKEKYLVVWSPDGVWWAADIPLTENKFGLELYMYPKAQIIGNVYENSELVETYA